MSSKPSQLSTWAHKCHLWVTSTETLYSGPESEEQYFFTSEVLPTPRSPRISSFKKCSFGQGNLLKGIDNKIWMETYVWPTLFVKFKSCISWNKEKSVNETVD